MTPRPSALLVAAFAVSAGTAVSAPPRGPERVVRPRATTPEVASARAGDGRTIFLAGAVFDPLVERPDFGSLGFPSAAAPEQPRAGVRAEAAGAPRWALVQMRPGRAAAARRELEGVGFVFSGYLPENAYRTRVTPEQARRLALHPDVRFVGAWEPGYKVAPELWPRSGVVAPELVVEAFPGASAATLAKAVEAQFPDAVATAVLPDARRPRIRVSVPERSRDELVLELSQRDDVSFLAPWYPPALHNNDSLGPVQSNASTVLSGGACTSCGIFQRGLTGTGQIVAVADSGLSSDTCFFRSWNGVTETTDAATTAPPAIGPLFPGRKVVGYFVQPGATAYDNNVSCQGNPSNSFHGTHTSGTAVGDNLATPSGSSSPGVDVGDGMAPNARLLFQDIGNDQTGCLSGLADNYPMFLQALQAGARISSNSWGGGSGGRYTGDDAVTDQFLFDHEEMAIFFSAGNDGVPTPPDPSTLGSPGTAKNVVTVGALGHGASTLIASYSSRGPTADGRIKPDLVAPGTGVTSALGNTNRGALLCQVQSLSGTSMACPTAAGASALLREYFADGFYPTGARDAANAIEPTAALVKAVLLNGTRPLPDGGSFGNGDYGWGRVFLDSNLYFPGDARKLRVFSVPNTSGLASGESRTHVLQVQPGQELRLTLVWSDAEATSSAGRALVNDLDLTVAGGGQTFRGNVFGSNGVSTVGGSPDRLNPVEQVRLTDPVAGAYTVTITASNVPGNGRSNTDRQGYALVASYATCSTGVSAAPTGLTAASDPFMGAHLAFAAAPASSSTQVYRAVGGCAARPGDFQLIGSSTNGSFLDGRAQGGTLYGYRVRGADGCGEGPASACVEITPDGHCDLYPVFDGLATATPDGARKCRIRLAWSAATAGCSAAGGAIRYNVYRSADPGFTPSPETLIASLVGVTSFDDVAPGLTGDPIQSNRSYFYVVRAEDFARGGTGPHGGNEESNGVTRFAATSGAADLRGTYHDGAEDGERSMTGEGLWSVSTAEARTGRFSYHAGRDDGNYPPDSCASLTTPEIALGSSGSVLSYAARYKLEFQWDGVVVEISNDGGATWTDLPPVTPSGYPDFLSQTGTPPANKCGFPPSRKAFTGPIGDGEGLSEWIRYETPIPAAFAGTTSRIRWRFTSDPGLEFRGFYLDDVEVTNVVLPGACQPVDPNAAPEKGLGGVVKRP